MVGAGKDRYWMWSESPELSHPLILVGGWRFWLSIKQGQERSEE